MTLTQKFTEIIKQNAPMSVHEIVENEVKGFLGSQRRKNMKDAVKYYCGQNDINRQVRTVIGENGKTKKSENLSDNKISHAFLRELIDQKVQYLLGKDFVIDCENKEYLEYAKKMLGASFPDVLRNIGKDAILFGIGWAFINLDQNGRFKFSRVNPMELIPLWQDSEHTILQGMIRVYNRVSYYGKNKKIVVRVDYYNEKGVINYIYDNNKLKLESKHNNILIDDTKYNWNKIPFVAFKYNFEEISLLDIIKSLVDDYDKIVSLESNLIFDQPNSILVIRNYDGQDLGEFRKNLSAFRAVKVSGDGGVETLNMPLDVAAYNSHLERLRRDIYAFGRGIDTRSEKFSSASGVALKYEYAQLDMDVNYLETGIKRGLNELNWFLNCIINIFYNITGELEFIFNRDIISLEADAIKMCKDSVGMISAETIAANHPWVKDVKKEMEAI